MGVIKFATLCNNRNFALKKCFQLIKILSFKMIQLFRNETNGLSTVYSQPLWCNCSKSVTHAYKQEACPPQLLHMSLDELFCLKNLIIIYIRLI